MIFIRLFAVALVTIYIVDISGFTTSWRGALAKVLHINVATMKPLPPFDCGACMTWWICLAYSIYQGQFTIWTIATSAMFSLLSVPIGGILIFIREWINYLVNELMP